MPLFKNIPCVILAGGKSSRMGENKALLPFGKSNLISYQYEKMCQIFQDVFISCKKNFFTRFEKNTLIEKDEVFSPLVGIRNAFLSLQAHKIFFVSVDTPFIKQKTLYSLCSIKDSYDVIYPVSECRSHYLVSLWDKNTFKELEFAIIHHQYKLEHLMDKLHTYAFNVDTEEEFYNLNTPEDYQNLTKISKG
ncbi:molybdenum cofactor guanylyltransferase MobA [Helicobacter cappadocius]|uniref:Probable molybdenum cofactor guanylyltransferase n=1 Tax=Helicobacter cappadocius TaxID=3063998 RepID=A0AA90PT61_9HELI|nr:MULTISPECIES: molybdenum cofactor guanylyltransferase MobA [unclassified Helicobacter]MDO7252403.1 molybdenum cofactor guanylyltransferase MobA [Helicobacter sp. faydin-H75]MDP2538270.1 molybdenum cofactor guanylyltransferase MobA [Helicobacter sp. faydin-H76]